MHIRAIVAIVAGGALTAAAASAAPAHHPRSVNARQHRQAERITDGRQDGQLTRGELDRIHGDEAAVRAEERVYRRSGGGLSRGERRDLQRDLNRTSREIYRDRHNARVPQP